jgi:hypothetical protein
MAMAGLAYVKTLAISIILSKTIPQLTGSSKVWAMMDIIPINSAKTIGMIGSQMRIFTLLGRFIRIWICGVRIAPSFSKHIRFITSRIKILVIQFLLPFLFIIIIGGLRILVIGHRLRTRHVLLSINLPVGKGRLLNNYWLRWRLLSLWY